MINLSIFSDHGKDPRKVFREMDKKRIGSHSAEFYKAWSEVEKKHDEPSAQLIIDKVRDIIIQIYCIFIHLFILFLFLGN